MSTTGNGGLKLGLIIGASSSDTSLTSTLQWKLERRQRYDAIPAPPKQLNLPVNVLKTVDFILESCIITFINHAQRRYKNGH